MVRFLPDYSMDPRPEMLANAQHHPFILKTVPLNTAGRILRTWAYLINPGFPMGDISFRFTARFLLSTRSVGREQPRVAIENRYQRFRFLGHHGRAIVFVIAPRRITTPIPVPLPADTDTTLSGRLHSLKYRKHQETAGGIALSPERDPPMHVFRTTRE